MKRPWAMDIDDLGPWTIFAAFAGGRSSSSLVLLVGAELLAHGFIVNFHNDKIKLVLMLAIESGGERCHNRPRS